MQFEELPYKTYLPLVLRSESTSSEIMDGTVTDNGSPVSGTTLVLRYFDGSSWSTYATTTTDRNGGYRFTHLPALTGSQRFYVRWYNSESDATQLSSWSCWVVTSTATAGDHHCSFDLQDITLLSPTHGSTISLPYTFRWEQRPIHTDDYEFLLADMSDYNPYWYHAAGYVDSYMMNGLPNGFSSGPQYGWWMRVYGPDGYGVSYYYQTVTFSNTGATLNSQAGPMTDHLSRNELEPVRPHPCRRR
jgi:hypothetical protein